MRKDVIIAAFFILLLAQSSAQSDCSPQYDGNGDGAVNTVDMLGLLSEFGVVCVDTTTSDTTSIQACGEPVSYQGYDYATVLIGEQCWFAENLRSENYENGDAIPSNISDPEWWSLTTGAVAIYGEGSGCDSYSTDIDPCDPAQSLSEYGRLYNWYAVDDARGLCPSGWHVPTDGDWISLEMVLGMSEFEANGSGWRGTDQGQQMKTNFGWYFGVQGTNTSGFSGLPAGYRDTNGYFFEGGATSYCGAVLRILAAVNLSAACSPKKMYGVAVKKQFLGSPSAAYRTDVSTNPLSLGAGKVLTTYFAQYLRAFWPSTPC